MHCRHSSIQQLWSRSTTITRLFRWSHTRNLLTRYEHRESRKPLKRVSKKDIEKQHQITTQGTKKIADQSIWKMVGRTLRRSPHSFWATGQGRLEENGRDKGFPTRDYGDLERGLGFLTCAVRSLVRNLFLTFSRSFSSFLRRGRKMGKRDCGKREGKSLLYEDLSAVPRLR